MTTARHETRSMPEAAGSAALTFAWAAFFLLVMPCTAAHARPGDVDPTFGEAGAVTIVLGDESEALRVVVQPDGKVLLGGIVVEGSFAIGLVRYLADGSPDPEFGSGGTVRTRVQRDAYFADLALQADGRIVVVGRSQGVDTKDVLTVVRYDASGALDATFGEAGIVLTRIGLFSAARAVVVQSDGKIVVAGDARGEGGRAFVVVRYLADGTPDRDFGDDGIARVERIGDATTPTALAYTLALAPDGRIVVAGETDALQGGTRFALARLTADGELDASFGDGGVLMSSPLGGDFSAVFALAIQPDGKTVAAGLDGCTMALLRYQVDGTPDPSFGDGGVATFAVACDFFHIHDIRLTDDGSILVPMSWDFPLVRFTPEGVRDVGFGDNGIVRLSRLGAYAGESVAVQADGKVVVAGRQSLESGNTFTFGFAAVRYEGDAIAQSRIETSPDGQYVLVGKDVFGERWAIARHVATGTVTGNVYVAGAPSPSFVWCEDVAAEPPSDAIRLDCYGADACTATPCTPAQWTPLGEVVLPSSFFTPERASRWLPIGGSIVLPESFFAPGGERGSGIQIARDGEGVLISKDVAGERWAITRDDAGAVSGNVFDPADGSADVLWCSPAEDGATGALSCFVAAGS